MLFTRPLLARAAWKGPFFTAFPGIAEAVKTHTPIRTSARACTILPNFIGLRFLVHNGKQYVPVHVTPEMVGHKLGEFAPSRQPYRGSTALLSSDPPTLFALTTDGFLVAVDVDTGDLRWRRQSTGGVAHDHLQLCGEVLLSASNRTTEAVSTESGKLLWAHESNALQSTAPFSQRLVCEAGPSPAVLSIVGSDSQRLDPRSGKSLSTVLLPTHSVYLPLQNDPDFHRVLAFEEKAAALLDVSSADGSITKVASANLPSRRGSPSRGIVLSAPATGHAAYLWIHDSRLSSVRVSGNGLVANPENFGSVRDFVRIGYENQGIALVSRSDGTTVILRLLDAGELEQIGQFKRSAGASRFAASLDQAGSLHIARLSWSTALQLSTVDVVSVSLEEKASAPIVSGQTIPIDLSTANTEDSFSFALYTLATGRLLPEFFVLFSSESSPLQAWRGTTLSWTSAAVDGATASLDQSRRTLVSSSNSIEMLIRGNSIQRSLWRHQFEDGTRLEHIAEQSSDTMLSPGRANADRSSSFKYRNPNVLAVVVSTSEANLSIRLLSLDNGVEVGRFLLPFTADPTAPVAIALVEDWIVCTFRTTSLSVPSNVLVSMYLSQQPDSETVLSQSRFFVSPKALHVEGFTKTRLGVASRDCLRAFLNTLAALRLVLAER
ncbi:hypothetical protein JCM16303_005370 [Sporobolomyces ruberrimus]